MENITYGQDNHLNNTLDMRIQPVPVLPKHTSSSMADLSLNQNMPFGSTQLSLGLSLSLDQDPSSTRHSPFQAITSFGNGDRIISVAWGMKELDKIKLKEKMVHHNYIDSIKKSEWFDWEAE